MLSSCEERSLRELLAEAVTLICSNTLSFQKEVAVKALVGITIDNDQTHMLDVSRMITKKNSRKRRNLDYKQNKPFCDDVISSPKTDGISHLLKEIDNLARTSQHVDHKINSEDIKKSSEENVVIDSNLIITEEIDNQTNFDQLGNFLFKQEEETEVNSQDIECNLNDVTQNKENDQYTEEVVIKSSDKVRSESEEVRNSETKEHTYHSNEENELVNTQDETVESSEQVFVVTDQQFDAMDTLQLLPGETFEYNGTIYEIAKEEPISDGPNLKSVEQKISPKCQTIIKKGNHTCSKKPKRFMCSLCSEQFTTHWGLKLHERLHKGDFRYHCEICGKGFASTNNLKGHMVKHSQMKEFACEFCGKAFAYRQSLERHQYRKSTQSPPCIGIKKKSKFLENARKGKR